MYSLVRISGEPPSLAGTCRPRLPTVPRSGGYASRMPRFRSRGSSRMLLVQQLREPIPPEVWHHGGEAERARLAAG